jgi:hypothetical protein
MPSIAPATARRLRRSSANTPVTSYSDNSLTGATAVFLSRAGLDGSASSSPPSTIAMRHQQASAVTSLSVTSWSNSAVVINWMDTNGEAGYRVERANDGVNYFRW